MPLDQVSGDEAHHFIVYALSTMEPFGNIAGAIEKDAMRFPVLRETGMPCRLRQGLFRTKMHRDLVNEVLEQQLDIRVTATGLKRRDQFAGTADQFAVLLIDQGFPAVVGTAP
jgi:hypothetical protein